MSDNDLASGFIITSLGVAFATALRHLGRVHDGRSANPDWLVELQADIETRIKNTEVSGLSMELEANFIEGSLAIVRAHIQTFRERG